MVDFRAIIENLKDIHFYDVILPFILIYAVIYAILEKSKIFEKKGGEGEERNVNAIIAFVFGLFVVASLQTVLYLQDLIVNMVVFVIFILVMLILLGFIFGEDYKQLFMSKDGNGWKIKEWAAWVIGLAVFLVALGALFYVTGTWEIITDFFDGFDITEDDFWTVTVIILMGFVVYWVSKDPKKDK